MEYYLSSTGHCDEKSEFISSLDECATAASALGLSDTTVQTITNEDRPFGCYFRSVSSTNQLWFNADDEASKNLNDVARQSVCKRKIVSFSPTSTPSVSITIPTMSPNVSPSRTPTTSFPSTSPTTIPSESPSSTPIQSTIDPTKQFYLSSNGRCDKRSEFIDTQDDCVLASFFVGLSDTTVEKITNEDRPFGCYYMATGTPNQLWFNADDEASKTITDNSRQSLCMRYIVSGEPSSIPSILPSSAPSVSITIPTMSPNVSPSRTPTTSFPSTSPTTIPSESPSSTPIQSTIDPTKQFYLSSNGRCDKRSEFIDTQDDCVLASFFVGLSDTTVEKITNEDRPFGCYYMATGTTNQLWFNADDEASKTITDNSRQSLCMRYIVSGEPSSIPSISP
jgi:hypothetical protein